MKKLLLPFLFLCAFSIGCEKEEANKACGYHNGNKLYLGPQGGCYYENSNGNKTYVNRSDCKC